MNPTRTKPALHIFILFTLLALLLGNTIFATPTYAANNETIHAQLATATATPNLNISIVNFSFQPAVLTINVGQTVTWTNNGNMAHTTTSDTAVWDSGTINPGGTFSFTFNTPGTYTYDCTFHGSMTGTIIVNELTTSTPTPSASPTPTFSETSTPTPTETITATPAITHTITKTATKTLTKTATPSTGISIVNFSFQPAVLTINVGQTVTWTNNGNMAHTTTSDTAIWDSGAIAPGGTFSFKFNTPGTYTYDCAFHGSMTGTIIVKALPTKTPTRTPTKTMTPTPTTITLYSMAVHDGWILESSENSSAGGTINNTGLTMLLGDSAAKQQYRSILSFNTSSLPDNATITGITLKLKKNGFVGGTNQITLFQGIMTEIKTGFFGTAAALQTSDFQAAADKTLGPATPALLNNFYNLGLSNGSAFINKLSTNGGVTQIRLRFKLDDNNDAIANYISLYSGNATLAADRPQLVITYLP